MKNIEPKLRFPEFQGDWMKLKLNDVSNYFNGGSFENNVNDKGKYELITLKSIDMNGCLAHSNRFIDIEVPTLNKDTLIMILSEQSPGLLGMTALIPESHKFVLNQRVAEIRPNPKKVDSYFLSMAINRNQRYFSKHGAGTKVQNITKPHVENYEFLCATLLEQKKIANFLSTIDTKIQYFKNQQFLLEDYKKGVMQKILSKELRFKDVNGKEFPEWKERCFNEVLFEHGLKSSGNEEVFSVSVHKGLINQIEHLGRSFSAKDTSNYNRVLTGDIVYTKSPTGDFPFGIIKQSRIDKSVIVSPLYGVFTPETYHLGYILNVYFESVINTHNYLSPIIQKGAKNTINITNQNFLSRTLVLPVSHEEQKKIADFLLAIDNKIEKVKDQIRLTEEWKKGLLQQMFV